MMGLFAKSRPPTPSQPAISGGPSKDGKTRHTQQQQQQQQSDTRWGADKLFIFSLVTMGVVVLSGTYVQGGLTQTRRVLVQYEALSGDALGKGLQPVRLEGSGAPMTTESDRMVEVSREKAHTPTEAPKKLTPEEYMEREKHEYFKRHGLLDASGEVVLEGFDEAYANMFPYDEATVEAITQVEELHATYPEDKPRGCMLILVYPIHCGKNCVAPMSKNRQCTQDMAVKSLLKDIHDQFLNPEPYPVVLLHQDLTETDKEEMRNSTRARVFFQKVVFNEQTVPSYIDKHALLSWLQPLHPDHDITQPSPKFHGFGYRMMCRMFSGLVFHAPLLRSFDYYIRVDGGDSRVGKMEYDIFKRLHTSEKVYGYLSWAAHGLPSLGPLTFEYMEKMNRTEAERTHLCELYGYLSWAAHGLPSLGPLTFEYMEKTNRTEAERTHLCEGAANGLPSRGPRTSEYMEKQKNQIKVERKHLSKAFDCGRKQYRNRYYYNNFEAVKLHAWRSKAHWDLFRYMDMSNQLVCNYDTNAKKCRSGKDEFNHIGDGDFRTAAAAVLFRKNQIQEYPRDSVSYAHPVPDWCKHRV